MTNSIISCEIKVNELNDVFDLNGEKRKGRKFEKVINWDVSIDVK